MAIKVFTEQPAISGYINNPATAFSISVPFVVYQSDGGEENGPRMFLGNAQMYLAIGSTPAEVYAAVYAQILADCATNGYDTPTKADIFAYAPSSLSTLLPDAPAMA